MGDPVSTPGPAWPVFSFRLVTPVRTVAGRNRDLPQPTRNDSNKVLSSIVHDALLFAWHPHRELQVVREYPHSDSDLTNSRRPRSSGRS